MAREIYTLTPISEITPTQINRVIVEINSVFSNISEQLAKLEGRDGRTISLSGDVDLGGKRIKNVGRAGSKTDVPNVEELVEKALYALGDRHVTTRLIEAQGGITVPRAEAGPDAVPLAQLSDEVSLAIGDLVTGPASATANAIVRFDGIAGKVIQDSGVIIDDLNNMLVPGEVEIDGDLDHDGSNVGFYGGIPAAQAAASANLTDNSGGTANDTVQALTNPVDTPASADALRDDLVANLIPELRNNFADLAAKVNKALTVLRDIRLMAI